MPKKLLSKTGLKPCPFCSSITLCVIKYERDEKRLAFIQCDDCHATGPACDNEAQARVLWDARAEPA